MNGTACRKRPKAIPVYMAPHRRSDNARKCTCASAAIENGQIAVRLSGNFSFPVSGGPIDSNECPPEGGRYIAPPEVLQLRYSSRAFALLPRWIHAIIFWQGSPPGPPPNRRRLPTQLADEQRLHAARGCSGRIGFIASGTRPTEPPGTRSVARRPPAPRRSGIGLRGYFLAIHPVYAAPSRGTARGAGGPGVPVRAPMRGVKPMKSRSYEDSSAASSSARIRA